MKAGEKRLTKPEADNKYYILSSAGGYAKGIAGSSGGTSVLPNCAGYAACRANEYTGNTSMKFFPWWPDAENFCAVAENAGLPTGKTPKVGSIICWRKGKTWNNSDGAGHVAFVEEVKSDGSIITSESAWGGSAFYTTHRYKESGNWGMNSAYTFVGFIYLPETAEQHTLLKLGSKGAEVELMQLRLKAKGYECGNIDGDFGRMTLRALLLFQYDHCKTIDGICGAETWGKLT